MADKEERILITKVSRRNCPVLSNDNICVLDYDCEECHAGISRSEAVERIAKAIFQRDNVLSLDIGFDKLEQCTKNFYLELAEASLDALLGGKK